MRNSKLDYIRDEDTDELPAVAWPGGYDVMYLLKDGSTVCADCARKLDYIRDEDTDELPAVAWPGGYDEDNDNYGVVDGWFILEIGESEYCDSCSRLIGEENEDQEKDA